MSLFCVKRLLNSFVTDGRTDRPTDRRTDGPTEKWLIVVYECLKNIQIPLKLLYIVGNAL